MVGRKWLTQVMLVFMGLALAFMMLELGLRVWFTQQGTEHDRILYIYDRETIANKTTQLLGLPYLNYGLNPAWEDINERGIRGPLVDVPKPDGIYRIVTLGGSTTFGHALAVEETWPAQLQRILREDYGYTQVEVVNLGAPGYFSLDSVVNLATHGLAHEPDMVIVYHGINDAINRMFQDSQCYQGDTPLYGMALDRGIWQVALDDLPPSTLYRVLAFALGAMDDPSEFDSRLEHTGLCPPEPQGISPVDLLAQHPPTHFERNMRSIAGMTQAAGATMVFSTFAWDVPLAEHALAENPEFTQLQAQLMAIDEQNDLLRRLAPELDALLVDLASELGEGTYFQGDMVHQTVEGARRQAEIYAAFLDAQGVISNVL